MSRLVVHPPQLSRREVEIALQETHGAVPEVAAVDMADDELSESFARLFATWRECSATATWAEKKAADNL